nr:unnamed protein product [Digitaria exilis]
MIQEFAPDAKVKARRTLNPSIFHADIIRIGAWLVTFIHKLDIQV